MKAASLLDVFIGNADTPDAMVRVRRLIFDLAIRGKLSTQSQLDEPAQGLLDRIEIAKRQSFQASGRKVPKLLSPLESVEIPFEIPANWEWTRIRQITSDRGQKIPDTDFTYIDVGAVAGREGQIVGAKELTSVEAPSRARKIVRKGDVLYSCVRPYLLNIAVVDREFAPEPIASTAFAVLDGHGLVHPHYQWIVLRSSYFITRVGEKMRGQAYPAINDKDFSQLPFPLPPESEQMRIVESVGQMLDLCDQLESSLGSLSVLRSHLLDAVATEALIN